MSKCFCPKKLDWKSFLITIVQSRSLCIEPIPFFQTNSSVNHKVKLYLLGFSFCVKILLLLNAIFNLKKIFKTCTLVHFDMTLYVEKKYQQFELCPLIPLCFHTSRIVILNHSIAHLWIWTISFGKKYCLINEFFVELT